MCGHADSFEQARFGIFEIEIRNAIGAAVEGRSATVIHAEQSGFIAAFVELADE
jgi:hypothetical protein